MVTDKENDKHIIADEGKVFQRISDNAVMGKEIWLGYAYYLNGKELDEPVLELPEHFREVEEEFADDTPVELPEEPLEDETDTANGPGDGDAIGDSGEDAVGEGMADKPVTMGELRRMQRTVAALATMGGQVVNALSLPPAVALSIQELYPEWNASVGSTVTKGFRFRHDGVLYEVLQDHALQEEWIPGAATTALYKVVTTQEEEESGTRGNPIAWMWGMELTCGKYYVDEGVLYKCTRDSGMPMSFGLKDLVSGGFVEQVK